MGLALRVHQLAPSETEQSLVAAVRNGNDAAFEELFSRYRDRINAYAHGAVGDHARAEDITQDVFISALRRMRETERPISFKPWIYEIARNACIDEFRRSRRASEVSLDVDGESSAVELQLASPDPTPDVVAEARQKISDLRGAFGGLSENHHRILVMRELEGLSYSEIGERLGMSRAMVESTLFRARKRLNQEFRELESGQRCEQVRSAIDRSELGSARILGIRERRQVARHMAYCQQCRQHAWTAGFDASSLKRRSVGQKIAALLPIGWWHAHAGGSKHAIRASSIPATKAAARLARYSEPLSQVGLGRAISAAAALAVAAAGGGYVVAGSSTHHSGAAAPAAVTLQPPPAQATAVFLRAGHMVTGASSTGTKTSSHGAGRHQRGGAGPRHHKAGPSGGHAATPNSAPSPGSSGGGGGSSASSTSARHATATQPHPNGGGRGLLGSLLGGGSPSSRTRLPGLPSIPSRPSASLHAPARLPAPAQGAVNAATQAANAATQVVNTAEQTVNSMGNTASNLVGGATNLGGSRTGH
jgi:RNA polymerase sigma factor (sigma-70 family)